MSAAPSDTARHVSTRLRAEHERIDARAARAREVARRLAGELVREHAIGRVWLTGSLARGTAHARSDIDLVLEVEPERLPALREWVTDRVDEFDVDVLALAALPAGWRARVERDGELL